MKKKMLGFLIFLLVLSGCATNSGKQEQLNVLQPDGMSPEEKGLASLMTDKNGLLLSVDQQEDFNVFESNLYMLKNGRWETLHSSASTLNEKISHIYIELDMAKKHYLVRHLLQGSTKAEGFTVEFDDDYGVSQNQDFVMAQMIESQNFPFQDGQEVCVLLCGYSDQGAIMVGLSDFEHPEAIDERVTAFAVTIKFRMDALQEDSVREE